jgi:hypothetical protein
MGFGMDHLPLLWRDGIRTEHDHDNAAHRVRMSELRRQRPHTALNKEPAHALSNLPSPRDFHWLAGFVVVRRRVVVSRSRGRRDRSWQVALTEQGGQHESC